MPDEQDQSSGFKVVDRRTFSEDRKRREDDGAADPGAEAAATPPRTSAEPAAAAPSRPSAVEPDIPETEIAGEDFAGEPGEIGPTGFDTLVSYLSTTAMFQLGFLVGPGGERIPADLVNARRTIDLLEVLQEKTEGNLTEDEVRMLNDVLYELRLSFVEVQQRAAQQKK
jgi:hypothetical protein